MSHNHPLNGLVLPRRPLEGQGAISTMSTQQGFSYGAPFQLIDDVEGLSHETFLSLSAAQFSGVQDPQEAAILTDIVSTFDPPGNPMRDDLSAQFDWMIDNSSPIPNNGLQHQDNANRLRTFEHNDATIGSGATSTGSIFVPQNNVPTLTLQPQVEENVSNIVLSGDFDESQLFGPQASPLPNEQEFRLEDWVNLTPSSTPMSTPGGNRSAQLPATPEETSPWYMVSPSGSLGAYLSTGGSEGNTPSSIVIIERPESLHEASETSSPGSIEQRIAPRLKSARTAPRPIFPTNNNPDAQATSVNGFLDVSPHPAPHVKSGPSHLLTSQEWGSKVSAAKRKKEEKAEESREDAKRVRKIGACVRCHMYKLKCDEGTPCQKCCRDATTHRLFFQPCSRQEILDAILVRHGNGKFGQERATYRKYYWTNLKSGPRTIEICWTLPGKISQSIQGLTLSVPCHEFILSNGDITAENWQVGGKITSIDLPRFACADNNKLRKIVEKMVDKNRAAVEEKLKECIKDPLAQATFDEAYRYVREHDSEMIKLALRIRSTAAFCQGWGSITGPETLGTPEVDGAEEGYCGTRPISPALCHQLDVIFLKMMERDEQALVKELKKAIFRKNPKPWYEIFLTYFVIMWHLNYIHGQAVGFMKSQEQTVSSQAKKFKEVDYPGGVIGADEAPSLKPTRVGCSLTVGSQRTAVDVSFVVKSMVNEWENSAGNMLYHFRYVLRAFLPFQQARENMAAVKKQGNLDDYGVSYLRTAVSLLDKRGWLTEKSNNASIKANEDPEDKWIRRLFEPWRD